MLFRFVQVNKIPFVDIMYVKCYNGSVKENPAMTGLKSYFTECIIFMKKKKSIVFGYGGSDCVVFVRNGEKHVKT